MNQFLENVFVAVHEACTDESMSFGMFYNSKEKKFGVWGCDCVASYNIKYCPYCGQELTIPTQEER